VLFKFNLLEKVEKLVYSSFILNLNDIRFALKKFKAS